MQGRAAARTDASAAAGMSTTLLGQLNLSQGRMPNYAANGKVVSPYTRLDQFQAAQVRPLGSVRGSGWVGWDWRVETPWRVVLPACPSAKGV